jgi:hypothetical protein
MGNRWSFASSSSNNTEKSSDGKIAMEEKASEHSLLPDPLPLPGSPLTDEVNPYAHHGNGWENYKERVLNTIPPSLAHEAMDRSKRLRFRARQCATDFPITIDAHVDQTVTELKEFLIDDVGYDGRFMKTAKMRLFVPKQLADSGNDEQFDALTLKEVPIRSGDFILFAFHFNENKQEGLPNE